MTNLCSLALVCGLISGVLRKVQWLAYDKQTELFTGSPVYLLPLFLFLAAAALLCLRCAGKQPLSRSAQPFYCPKTEYMVLMTISAFLFLGAGMLGLLTGFQRLTMWRYDPASVMLTDPASMLLCALLCFPSGLAVLLMGKEGYRGADKPRSPVLSMLPPFTGIVWLFSTHMEHSTDPVLLRYGFLMAAVIFLTLAAYDGAGLYQAMPHPKRFLLCSACGIILGFVALADRDLSLFRLCLLPAFLLLVTTQLCAYLTPAEYIPTDSYMEAE